MAPNTFRIVVGLLLAGIALIALSPWSGSGGPAKPTVANAADATSHQTHFRYTFTVSDPSTGQPAAVGGGVQNGERGAGRAKFAGRQELVWTTIYDGAVTYSQTNGPGLYLKFGTVEVRDLPGLDLPLPPGKRWLKLDLSDQPEAGEQMKQFTPNSVLKELRAVAELTEEGPESIRGEPTTHYKAEIDVAKKIEQLRSDGQLLEADDFQRQVDLGGAESTISADVWVGEDGFVHRYSSPLDSGAVGSLQMDFFDFGGDFPISLPPAHRVFDGTSLLERQLG